MTEDQVNLRKDRDAPIRLRISPTVAVYTQPCPHCGDVKKLDVTPDEAVALTFSDSRYIQDVLPNMSAGDRERFISGYCPTCWDKLFPEED